MSNNDTQDCTKNDLDYALNMTLEQVERSHHIAQWAKERYYYIWRNSCPRFSSLYEHYEDPEYIGKDIDTLRNRAGYLGIGLEC